MTCFRHDAWAPNARAYITRRRRRTRARDTIHDRNRKISSGGAHAVGHACVRHHPRGVADKFAALR
eukprot:1966448-Pyramimonas_sp.AAC.1